MPEAAMETTVELNGVRLYTRRLGQGPTVDRPEPGRPHGIGPRSKRSRKVSPHRVRAIRRRLLSRHEPRAGDDAVSRHRAHPSGGVGEPGRVRSPQTDPTDLSEWYR